MEYNYAVMIKLLCPSLIFELHVNMFFSLHLTLNIKLCFSNNWKPHREVDTLPLRKRIPHKFNAKERSPLTQKFQYKPLYIKLQPNNKYIITHEGMGARVNIIKYYHTDSLGKLHPDD